MSAPLLSPHRLLARYREGSITFEEWQEGMQKQCAMAIEEAEEDRANPKLAWMETIRCKNAARKLLRNNKDIEIREVFMALSLLEDFPPAVYLWNAVDRKTPLHCLLREKRFPAIHFSELVIRRLSTDLVVEYGSIKAKERTRERITLERDWQGDLNVKSRNVI